MPERAWVSTSSVRKTFVTPSSLMRELELMIGLEVGTVVAANQADGCE
jgi:hypothetical protein